MLFLEDPRVRAAGVSVISNISLVIMKTVVGITMGSVSVLSEAIHSGLDLLAAAIAFFSLRQASRPADERHQYGHGKIENVSGVVEAVLIFFAAAWILLEAIRKLIHGAHVESLVLGMAVMGTSSIVNIFVSRFLMRTAVRLDSVALKADAIHLSTDVWTSVGVFVGLALIHFTHLPILDPIAAIVVAALIIRAAWELTEEAFAPLLDARLPEAEEKVIEGIIKDHADRYVGVHKLRTRKAGGEVHVDLHMVFHRSRSLVDAHDVAEHIEQDVKQAFPRSSIVIHLEPCAITCEDCDQLDPAKCQLAKRSE